MDHQQGQLQRDRSPSVGLRQHSNINQAPSPGLFAQNDDPSIGIGLGLDQASTQQFQQSQLQHQHRFSASADFSYGAPNPAFLGTPQQSVFESAASLAPTGGDSDLNFPAHDSSNFSFADPDFSLFPPTNQGDQFDQPLFEATLNANDMAQMTSPQINQSPTPPHHLRPDAQSSPAFNQHHFSSPPTASHSRHASLGPEAALLPNDWAQPQFQGHRRTPSEYSDVSSVAPSPHLASHDTFEPMDGGHSPMQLPQDPPLYTDVLGMGNISLADGQHSPNLHGRSPSHSPAISPRILPSSMPDMGQPSHFGLAQPYGGYEILPSMNESFPPLHSLPAADMSQMVAPPTINIEMAPQNANTYDQQPKTTLDQDALTPPERGRVRQRPRAVTDPYNTSGVGIRGLSATSSLSPQMGSMDSSSRDSSRSLSPLDRSQSAASRRRQSTSAVPTNVIALRLVDPEYSNSPESGNAKRAQKHPATFQCTLCPKRFTRAYNLRSHLRTHTDERPFVCTVCGKAFARQHDRKRHESLHSGEKKFICKGELKAGSQWGCGRRFARADALGRHFRSEAGRICIRPLLDEEAQERQRQWSEQNYQQNMANMAPMGMDPNGGYPMDTDGNYQLPAALLVRYPALAALNMGPNDGGGNSGLEDEPSGRSSFDASDFDDGEDTGYVSGPGTGYGQGSMPQSYGDLGYASDYGQPSGR